MYRHRSHFHNEKPVKKVSYNVPLVCNLKLLVTERGLHMMTKGVNDAENLLILVSKTTT